MFTFQECKTPVGESYFQAEAGDHTFHGNGVTKKLTKSKALKEMYENVSLLNHNKKRKSIKKVESRTLPDQSVPKLQSE